MDVSLLLAFLVSGLVGALIGVEREHVHAGKTRFGGIRVFIFIALFGTLSAMLDDAYSSGAYSSLIMVMAFVGVMVVISLSYVAKVYLEKSIDIANEVAAFITFLLGVMCYTAEFQVFAVILAIIITTLLATKRITHEFAKKLKHVEIFDTLKFAIIALVILPVLPDEQLHLLPAGLSIQYPELYAALSLNFYHVWLMVVFISGISFIGYVLVKIFGEDKGIGITGLAGGLVSSTAVTMTMAAKVKENELLLRACVFATVIACAIMFMRIVIEVMVVNFSLLGYVLVSMLSMALTGVVLAAIVWKGKGILLGEKMKIENKEAERSELVLKSPFSLMPAIKFGLFFAVILLTANIVETYFGNSGIYALGVISGLADVDAITLTMATKAGAGEIADGIAVTTITLAAISNTIVKFSIAYLLGTRAFGKLIGMIFGVIILVGLLTILL